MLPQKCTPFLCAVKRRNSLKAVKGTILLYESYLCILLVFFVGTARSSSVVRVNGRTVIVLPLPVAWSLALDCLGVRCFGQILLC
jgi:hypothetical protein